MAQRFGSDSDDAVKQDTSPAARFGSASDESTSGKGNQQGESGNPEDGFVAHATKTLRALPDAFQSGRILTDPLKAVGQSMQDYITTPSVHNFLRAIPGVGMAEDAITQPYRTAKSGDIAGAWGDAADLGGQLLAGRAGGAIPKVSEPLRTVTVEGGESALPSMNPIAGAALRLIPGGKLLRGAYDFARESGIGPKARTTRVVGPPVDTTLASDYYPQPMPPPPLPRTYSGRPSTPGMSNVHEFGPIDTRPEVEVGGAHIPNYNPPAVPPAARPLPAVISGRPSTMGPTPGQYDAPRFRLPEVEVGGAHIPDYNPPVSPAAERPLPTVISGRPSTPGLSNVEGFGSSSRLPTQDEIEFEQRRSARENSFIPSAERSIIDPSLEDALRRSVAAAANRPKPSAFAPQSSSVPLRTFKPETTRR